MEPNIPRTDPAIISLEEAADRCDASPKTLIQYAARGDIDVAVHIPTGFCAYVVVRNFVADHVQGGTGRNALYPDLVYPFVYRPAKEVLLTLNQCDEIRNRGRCSASFFPATQAYTEEGSAHLCRLRDRQIIPGWRERFAGRRFYENSTLSAWGDFSEGPPALIAEDHDELSYWVSQEGVLLPKPKSIDQTIVENYRRRLYPDLHLVDMESKLRNSPWEPLDEKGHRAPFKYESWFAIYPDGYTPSLNKHGEFDHPATLPILPSDMNFSTVEIRRFLDAKTQKRPKLQRKPSELDLRTHKNTSTILKKLNDVAVDIWVDTSPIDENYPKRDDIVKEIESRCDVKNYLAMSAELLIRPDYADESFLPHQRERLGNSFRSTWWNAVLDASEKYWAKVDVSDPTQCIHNNVVRDWLHNNFKIPVDVALHAAIMLRPDNAKKSVSQKASGTPE